MQHSDQIGLYTPNRYSSHALTQRAGLALRSIFDFGLGRVMILMCHLAILTGCIDDPQAHYPFLLLAQDVESQTDINQSPVYRVQKVNFSYLQQVDSLDHRYFLAFSGVGYDAQFNLMGDRSLHLRYDVKDQTVIPRDFHSLSLLSSAYQVDWVLAHMQEATGIHPDQLLELRGKFSLLHDIPLTEEKIVNNAFYQPFHNHFGLYRSSKGAAIPLSANLSVVSHEFGHYLWYYLFYRMDQSAYDVRALDSVARDIRGLNEGYADLLSFTLTGSASAIAGSYEAGVSNKQQVQQMRCRNFTITTDNDNTPGPCAVISDFYHVGTMANNAYFNALVAMGWNPSSAVDRNQAFQLLTHGLAHAGTLLRTEAGSGVLKFFQNWSPPANGETFLHRALQLIVDGVRLQNSTFAEHLRESYNAKFPVRLARRLN